MQLTTLLQANLFAWFHQVYLSWLCPDTQQKHIPPSADSLPQTSNSPLPWSVLPSRLPISQVQLPTWIPSVAIAQAIDSDSPLFPGVGSNPYSLLKGSDWWSMDIKALPVRSIVNWRSLSSLKKPSWTFLPTRVEEWNWTFWKISNFLRTINHALSARQ